MSRNSHPEPNSGALTKEAIDRITVGGCDCKSAACSHDGPLYMRQLCHRCPTIAVYSPVAHILLIRCAKCLLTVTSFHMVDCPPLHCPECDAADDVVPHAGVVWIKYRHGSGMLESECIVCKATLGGGRLISLPEVPAGDA